MALPRVVAHLADTTRKEIQDFFDQEQLPDDRTADVLPGPDTFRGVADA